MFKSVLLETEIRMSEGHLWWKDFCSTRVGDPNWYSCSKGTEGCTYICIYVYLWPLSCQLKILVKHFHLRVYIQYLEWAIWGIWSSWLLLLLLTVYKKHYLPEIYTYLYFNKSHLIWNVQIILPARTYERDQRTKLHEHMHQYRFLNPSHTAWHHFYILLPPSSLSSPFWLS